MRRIPFALRQLLPGIAVLLALAAPAARAQEAVDLELVLAIDVSGSIDYHEAKLQREGYVAAIADPQVVEAIRSGVLQRIALTYVEWAGDKYQRTVVNWSLIHDEASARAFVAELADASITTERFTSISAAIDFAVSRFAENDFEGTRLVVDISGDGPNNIGRIVQEARDDAVAAGITINGLPIMSAHENSLGFPNLGNLDLYYQDCVIGGPGAFTVVADSFEAFADAIRRKLILEIAGAGPEGNTLNKARRHAGSPASGQGARVLPVADSGPPYPDCEIGERQLIDFFRSRNLSPF